MRNRTEPSLNFEVMRPRKNYVCFEASSSNYLCIEITIEKTLVSTQAQAKYGLLHQGIQLLPNLALLCLGAKNRGRAVIVILSSQARSTLEKAVSEIDQVWLPLHFTKFLLNHTLW